MKILIAGTIAAAAAAAVLTPAAAYAHTGGGGKLPVCHATFAGHPESSSPPWATDTFTRTTKFHDNGDGTYKVHITDRGHFTTVVGTKSDSGDTIQNEVTGVFAGSGDYTVTSPNGPRCGDQPESYTGTGGPATGDWPKHYFGEGATTTGIDPWSWLYRTCREYMVEDSVKGTVGNMAGKACHTKPAPSPSPTSTTASPAPTSSVPAPSPTSTTPAGQAPAPTPVTGDLPVTG